MTAPIMRDRWNPARIADGQPLRAVASRDGTSQDGLYRRLQRACERAGVANTFALLALAVDQEWIVRTFEGWIVPDEGAPKRGHAYLSTSCWHAQRASGPGEAGDLHRYCQADTTISRIETGAIAPDLCSLLALTVWVGMPLLAWLDADDGAGIDAWQAGFDACARRVRGALDLGGDPDA